MEKFLMFIATLSLVAFIMGMLNPKVVKCTSRGKVAIVFIGLFLGCIIIGVSMSDEPKLSAGTEEAPQTHTTKEAKVLAIGDVLNLPYANDTVTIVFKNIKINKLPNNGLNLVFTLRIKNNSNEMFFISNSGWKLLDSEHIEVEESGIYEPMFGDFAPGTFFFTTVEPNIGKEEKVGYSVKEEDYYLSVNGYIMARIPIKSQK